MFSFYVTLNKYIYQIKTYNPSSSARQHSPSTPPKIPSTENINLARTTNKPHQYIEIGHRNNIFHRSSRPVQGEMSDMMGIVEKFVCLVAPKIVQVVESLASSMPHSIYYSSKKNIYSTKIDIFLNE